MPTARITFMEIQKKEFSAQFLEMGYGFILLWFNLLLAFDCSVDFTEEVLHTQDLLPCGEKGYNHSKWEGSSPEFLTCVPPFPPYNQKPKQVENYTENTLWVQKHSKRYKHY